MRLKRNGTLEILIWRGRGTKTWGSHLSFELLELFLLLLSVFFYLFLGLGSGILDSFRAVCGALESRAAGADM